MLLAWAASLRAKSRNTASNQNLIQKSLFKVFRPIAVGQIFSSLEYLSQKDIYSSTGYLRGVSSATVPEGTLRHSALRILDSKHAPRVIAAANLAAATTLLAFPRHRKVQIGAASVIAVCNRLNEVRTPYGRDGADQMTAVITQYRLVTAVIPDQKISDDLFLRAVNYQTALSYFVSGFSKFMSSSWMQGYALQDVLSTESYGQSKSAMLLHRYPRINRVLTHLTLWGEMLMPVIYIMPSKYGHMALVAAKGFHLGIAVVMELPRFFWGFASSHSAVAYVLESRRSIK